MHRKLVIFGVSFALGAFSFSGHSAESAGAAQPDAATPPAGAQAERQFNEAESAYRKALSLDPLNTAAISGLVDLYRQHGMFARAQLTIAQLTAAQRSALGPSLKRIESTMLQDQADLRLAKGQQDQAIKYLEQAVQVDADDTWLHFKLAKQYARRGAVAMGQTLLDDFVVKHPGNPDALYALAQYQSDTGDVGGALKTMSRIEDSKRTHDMTLLQQRLVIAEPVEKTKSLVRAGKKGEAASLVSGAEDRAKVLQQLDEWAAGLAANESYAGVHLAGVYFDLGEYDRARKLIDNLIASHPEASYVLYDAWKRAERAGRIDDEIHYLKKLVVAYPRREASPKDTEQTPPPAYGNIGIDDFGSPDKIQRDWKEKKLAALIDRRSNWSSSAIDARYRSGTPGLSEFHSLEIPLEYKAPWHGNDEVSFRAEVIKLGAGDVDPTNTSFGSMLSCQPACAQASLSQAVQGLAFTAGYQRSDFGADIGFTPLNFPVSNIVGAIKTKGDLGEFGYSLEASRRPVTASLLSYAGARDPNTGKVWGGVVATGARLGLSLDKGGTSGFWSSFGWHDLTGRDVLSNRRVQVMAGEQWRIINQENRKLVAGVTGMYWNFSEDAGEYTFGHGGYYSPHNYRSLSLPVTYMARSARFSYMLRGSISASRAQMQDARYYPTDADLQSAAGNPMYTGGISTGTGHSLMAAWEYQLDPRLFAGGLFSIDRSYYYAPNRALVYLRYSFDHPGAQPVFMPPEPMEPSSQF